MTLWPSTAAMCSWSGVDTAPRRLFQASAKNEDDAVDDAGASLSAEAPSDHAASTGGMAEGDDVDVVVTQDPPVGDWGGREASVIGGEKQAPTFHPESSGHDRSAVAATLVGLTPGPSDEPGLAAARERPKDGGLYGEGGSMRFRTAISAQRRGRVPLAEGLCFVNAAIQDDEDKPQRLPSVVDTELP
ncbi:hypothetical protein LZ30DRAFT_779317 [Colletotrichum cereale]|nr:hypothetical protein LZ30DRAFT_779317 [Colletotrichum cereale]